MNQMFDFERELKRDLERIAMEVPAPPDWRKTKIGNNRDAIMADARRFLQPDWWKRAEPRDDQSREIIRLVERAGLGTLQIRDGKEEENRQFGGGSGMTTSEIAEAQQNAEKVGIDELSPDDNESIADWLGRLGARIDSNGHRKALWAGLRGYVSRFRGDAKAKTTLDKKLVRRFLQHALG
jgi:hypothetical protein